MNPGPTLVIKVKLKGVARWQDKKRWQAAQTKVSILIFRLYFLIFWTIGIGSNWKYCRGVRNIR